MVSSFANGTDNRFITGLDPLEVKQYRTTQNIGLFGRNVNLLPFEV
jgi:hypothetical protein